MIMMDFTYIKIQLILYTNHSLAERLDTFLNTKHHRQFHIDGSANHLILDPSMQCWRQAQLLVKHVAKARLSYQLSGTYHQSPTRPTTHGRCTRQSNRC